MGALRTKKAVGVKEIARLRAAAQAMQETEYSVLSEKLAGMKPL